MNLLPLADSVDILTVVHPFRLLTCSDSVMKQIAWKCVRCVVKRRIGNKQKEEMLAKYLSGSLNGSLARRVGDVCRFWTRARTICRRLN